MAVSRIIDLRKLLAERFPAPSLPTADQLATGLAALDRSLGGGLTKSAITELIAPPGSAGSASIVAALLQSAARSRSFLVLIDGADSFDPSCSGGTSPAALPHLLWIRCRQASEAMQAADLLLRDGNFPLVVLDLVLNPLAELRRIPSSNWYRLQRLIEPAPTALLALTPRSMISSAHWKVVLENRWTLPQLDGETVQLQAQMKMRLERAQPNKWRSEQRMAWAS